MRTLICPLTVRDSGSAVAPLGETWTQESLIGSSFSARYRWHARDRGEITPTITGAAHVTGQARLRLDPDDPFCWGIRP